VKYEAEGQAGKILEGDEARVAGVALRRSMDVHGKTSADAELEGEPAATTSAEAQVLLETHPFYCLRFPTEAVGIGAKWNDTCKRRVGGVVGTREVVWELAKLEPGAPETGRRAELSYVGRYTEPTADGKERRGTVQGAVFFLVDRGEPYMIREQITVDVDPANALRTLTQLNHTFMHPRSGKPGKDGKPREELVLTTGDPAPAGINAPRPPEGAKAK
jgi:hypothetical protein